MKNKLSFRDWHKILRDTRSEVDQRVAVLAVGAGDDLERLIEFLGPGADKTVVKAVVPIANLPVAEVDMLLVAVSAGRPIENDIIAAARDGREAGVEVLALIDEAGLSEAAKLAKQVELEINLDLSPGKIYFFSAQLGPAARAAVLSSIAGHIPEKAVALAAGTPAFRPLVAAKIVDEIAAENAFIGAASFIPASDLPVLTANQIRMVLKIAAAYGMNLTLKRAKELLAVIGGGFTLRALARQVVGLVPVAGWAVKGLIAYTGTKAIGDIAIKYFAYYEQRGEQTDERV